MWGDVPGCPDTNARVAKPTDLDDDGGERMTGYTVHTGSNEKFTDGWDQIFSGGKKSAKKKTAKKKSTKKKTTAKATRKKAKNK
jgi:topoisomerase IA-like protein